MNDQHEHPNWIDARKQMIKNQILSRGISDPRVLEVMSTIPREQFVPDALQKHAYEDRALKTQQAQTISQPYIVAYMTQHLSVSPASKILEIGTGTGYQTAILATLGAHVFTVERWPELRHQAENTLSHLNIHNVSYLVGDGSLGWPQHAPFDRIIVTAGAPQVPDRLTEQLADDGILIIPVGKEKEQILVTVIRRGSRTIETPTLPCRFVKLIGKDGWPTGSQ